MKIQNEQVESLLEWYMNINFIRLDLVHFNKIILLDCYMYQIFYSLKFILYILYNTYSQLKDLV